MYKLLIPLFFCLFGSVTLLHAQVPKNITVSQPVIPVSNTSGEPELVCGDAGTFMLGQFIGNSNDFDLDTIYLCMGDSIFIDHNGDSDLSGDPDPATPPGIGWGFYTCPPTVIGDTLANVLADPCLLPGAVNGIWLATGTPEGDTWFFNNGSLQTAFNAGQPFLIHFAPITIDDFATNGYESSQVGFEPGPCVNVNTGAQFAVVYLNAITESGVSSNFGNDCLGKFRVRGGLPEFDTNERYTIDISLSTDPSIKAVIHTTQSQYQHSADIIFSVPQPGTYDVTISDGKSCPHSFQITMGVCDASDNVTLDLPDLNALPGTQICVPIIIENFEDIVGGSFSLNWDPNILSFLNTTNENDSISRPNDEVIYNTNETAQGNLGVVYFNQLNLGANITDGDTLFEICFDVVGMLGECSPLYIINTPTAVQMENSMGNLLAVTVDTGSVCLADLPLSFTWEVVDTTCIGTAAIAVTPVGGMPPYEVIWQELPAGATNNDILLNSGDTYITEQLPSGTYEIRVTDMNGLGTIILDTVTLDIPILGASMDFSQLPTCNGSCDGEITANVFVGGNIVPPPAGADFTFTWSANAPDPGAQIQDSVCAGNYAVTVTQVSTGCSATASGTLGQPTAVDNAIITVEQASCSGITDGSITYNAEGGNPFPGSIYTFEWNYSTDMINETPFSAPQQTNPSVLNGLISGFYHVTITDMNGCTFTDVVEVTDSLEVNMDTLAQIDANCFGSNDGTIIVEMSYFPAQPNPNFTFFWNGPCLDSLTNTATMSTLTDLCPGTYNVIGVDANGCSDVAMFEISEPAEIVIDTVALMNPTCQNMMDGSIEVIATGGVGTFSYSWSDLVPGNPRTNLPPGTYTVFAVDDNNCIDSLAFDLVLPNPPMITGFDSTSVTCGDDGCLEVNVDAATSYQWFDINGTPIGTDSVAVCGLSAGSYYVIVTNAENCVASDTAMLVPHDTLFISDTTFMMPSCFGYPDGSIAVGTMGGNQPIQTYSWSSPAPNAPIINAIPAGIYTVTITDLAGCTIVDSFELLNPPPIVSSIQIPMPMATCSDSCDGQATISAFYGGGGMGDFNYFWSDGGTDSVRIDLCPGWTSVTITENGGNSCFRIDSVNIAAPPAVEADTIFAIDVTCFGDADGQAFVEGTGGNGTPYTYLWETSDMTANITNLTPTNYSVTITDSQGCTGVANVDVGEPDQILVGPDPAAEIPLNCFEDEDGALGALVTQGGVPQFTYIWSDANMNIIGNTQVISDLGPGQYTVTVTDANGCTAETQMGLSTPPPVSGVIEPWEPLNCFGDQTIINIDTIFGGNGGPYQYSIDNGVRLDPDFPITVNGGLREITFFDFDGCTFTDTINIVEPDPLEVIFTPDVIEIELGDTSLILNPNILGSSVDSLIWTPSEFLFPADSLNPTVQVFDSETFTLQVWDANGCTGEGSIYIQVDPNRNVYVPNVFKPGNTSGLNDHFNVFTGLGVELVNYMQVYDRWGELLYERTNFLPNNDILSEGWDGRYRGKFVDPGVYIYVIEVRFLDGRELLYRGDVTVSR